MEPEIIDWDNIDSEFVEDDTYENLNAPKWVDLSVPDDSPFGEDDWFCNCDCKHPKTAEDYPKSTQNSKVKFLRSVTVSEMFHFRNKSFRDGKLEKTEITHSKTLKAKGYVPKTNLSGDNENKNPNLDTLPVDDTNTISEKGGIKSRAEKKPKLVNSHANSSKPRLRSTFSARNLRGGKEIMNKITEVCYELKRLVKERPKKGTTENSSADVLGEKKERTREKERRPLLEVKER